MGVFHDAEQRARLRKRESLFVKTLHKEDTGRLSWAIDYSPRAMAISQIVKKHWHLVANIPGCCHLPLIGYRKTRSLRSILVHSEVSIPEDATSKTVTGHHNCGQCNVCQLMITTKEITFADKGFSHKLNFFSNCKTRYCVYMLVCVCGKIYIGSTRCQLLVRVQEHISCIKHETHRAPLVQHFTSHKHAPTDFSVSVLEIIQPSTHYDANRLLLQRESFWIF